MGISDTLSRGWKHASRAVSKPFVGANVDNLQQLERLMVALDSPGGVRQIQDLRYLSTVAPLLKHGSYDFTWVTVLTAEEFRSMNVEWKATLQAHARSARRGAGSVTSQLTASERQSLTANTKLSEMWKALQNTKDRFRAIAKSKVEGFFGRQARRLNEFRMRIEDEVHRNPRFGIYLSYYQAAEASYDHASLNGATNDLQRKILAGGGLYRVIKQGAALATGLVRTVATAGADLSAVKKVVTKGIGLLNSLGGLMAGIVDLASGREADWRTISARYGLDQSIEQLKLRLRGRTQAHIRDQVISGPQQLARGAALMEEDLVELRKVLRQSVYWMSVFEKDIAEIKQELSVSDLTQELNTVLTRLGGPTDGVIKPSQIASVGSVERIKRAELIAQAAEAETKLKGFKDAMEGHLNKLNELLAGIDTRRDVIDQQARNVELGREFDVQRTLAGEVQAFDRSRLRRVTPNADRAPAPAATGIRAQIEGFDRSRLKAADLLKLNPPPASMSGAISIQSLLINLSQSDRGAEIRTHAAAAEGRDWDDSADEDW